jgi:hypothetical protein
MWVKPDAKPQRNKVKRLMNSFEYILIFSKSKKYNYNQFKLYNSDKAASVSRDARNSQEMGRKFQDFIFQILLTNVGILCSKRILLIILSKPWFRKVTG